MRASETPNSHAIRAPTSLRASARAHLLGEVGQAVEPAVRALARQQLSSNSAMFNQLPFTGVCTN